MKKSSGAPFALFPSSEPSHESEFIVQGSEEKNDHAEVQPQHDQADRGKASVYG